MTSKKFLISIIFIVLLMVFGTISKNLYFDDFGLFRSHKERRIWRLEKTSKYLMSFKYIPENFNAVLVGSSVSANMDPSTISKYNVYNLSMNSGNITELNYPLENLIKSDSLDAIIFCLYDYTTKNSGIKGKQINLKEYWGSLFSTIPFELLKSKIKYKLKPQKDVYLHSSNGFNNFNISKRHIKMEDVNRQYLSNPRERIVVDSTAFIEFEFLVQSIHEKNIKIYAFFYPIYYEWFDVLEKNGEWEKYKDKMLSVFNRESDIVWDMNTEEYDYIRKSMDSFTDGHLSDKGAIKVISVIDEKIK